MALLKLADAYPNYKQEIFGGDDIKGYDVYSEGDEKIGGVYDALVDESGRFRYFVIDTGFWIFGKKILVPIGSVRLDYDRHRVYVTGMTKAEAESMPEYNDDMTIDYDYEERVRSVFRPTTAQAGATAAAAQPTYDRNSYDYEHEQHLYTANEGNNQRIRLYEERLLTNKNRVKTGEVAVGKRIETETARVSVPVEKERLVIERTTPSGVGTTVTPGTADFREGEVAHMSVYEETAEIGKQAFVREEVTIRKEVERGTVDATETLRREELEVDVNGKPVIQPSHDRLDHRV